MALNRRGNRQVAQWAVDDNPKAVPEREPALDQPTLEALAVSRDGRLVATSEAFDSPNWPPLASKVSEIPPPQIRVWDTTTGKEVHRFTGFRSRCTSVCFAPDGKRLASAFDDGTALVWEIKPPGPAPQPLSALELQRLWADLASADAARAHEAITALVSAPDQAVALIRRQLRPVPADATRPIEQLLRGLNSEAFEEREKSTRELTKMCTPYRSLLQQACRDAASLEVKRRLEVILAGDTRRLPLDLMRILRSVQTLERIGSAEARRTLADLATGAAGALQTHAAREALVRLQPTQ